ncbi:hypothetical protein PGT21_006030 [Puccinia graminis f. sp. tritici]|uniref:Spindle pole body component n=1 Tax=Puccinia graminis f. sp. tritici TaxID=56615 RepID=A0A5B0QMH7_PUCGR|nr:hypothetical protein PGT21_006030 [Puccinia graminis f. sp. tritici]
MDGVIQESLLILAGHGHEDNLVAEEEQHNSPLRLINTIATNYKLIKQHTQQTSNNNINALNSTINNQLLKHYQQTLIDLELKLLTHHPSLVPANQHNQPAPPLSTITAQLNQYQPILLKLNQLINQLPPTTTTTQLIQLIHNHQSSTGSPPLALILNNLQLAIEQLWINQFRSFIIHQSKQELFHLNNNQFSFNKINLPILPSLEPRHELLHTINQICHAISILNNLNSTRLPKELQQQLTNALQSIHSISNPHFRIALKNIQEILSNYLFSNYLTREILSTTLKTITDIFFLRNTTFRETLVEGLVRLKANQTTTSERGGGRGRRRMNGRELDVLLLKAGISTELGEDPGGRPIDIQGFSFQLLQESSSENQDQDEEKIQNKNADPSFSRSILSSSQPVSLTYSPKPGLSLFLTKPICQTYADIHRCLFAFLIGQQTYKEAWRELSQKERLRSRLDGRLLTTTTTTTLKATGGDPETVRALLRVGFEGLRRIGWFLDTMLDYFFAQVIEPSIESFSAAIEAHYQSLSSSSAHHPSTADSGLKNNNRSSTSADFFAIHAHFLARIQTGLLALEPQNHNNNKDRGGGRWMMVDLLDCCFEFLALLQAWSFELIPSLLSDLSSSSPQVDDQSQVLRDRRAHLTGILERFTSLLDRFVLELRRDHHHQSSHHLSSSRSNDQQQKQQQQEEKEEEDLAGLGIAFFEPGPMMLADLKAAGFRRACLDALGLKFDFNLAFDSARPFAPPPPAPPPTSQSNH